MNYSWLSTMLPRRDEALWMAPIAALGAGAYWLAHEAPLAHPVLVGSALGAGLGLALFMFYCVRRNRPRAKRRAQMTPAGLIAVMIAAVIIFGAQMLVWWIWHKNEKAFSTAALIGIAIGFIVPFAGPALIAMRPGKSAEQTLAERERKAPLEDDDPSHVLKLSDDPAERH